jgi:hypothetical protein
MSSKKKTKPIATETPKTSETFAYEIVQQLPARIRKEGLGKYLSTIKEIAKLNRKATIKLNLGEMKLKSAYPSFERALEILARINGVDFNKKETRLIERLQKDGSKKPTEFVSYPQFNIFKKTVMGLRCANKELYIEKLIDKPLKTEE